MRFTSHMHSMAITWGLSVFGATELPGTRCPTGQGRCSGTNWPRSSGQIWEAAEVETGDGTACNSGQELRFGRRGTMTVVPVSSADRERRLRLLTETVLPGWVADAVNLAWDAWNGGWPKHLA